MVLTVGNVKELKVNHKVAIDIHLNARTERIMKISPKKTKKNITSEA